MHAYQPQGVTLVGMESPLHEHHCHTLQGSKEESGHVTGDGRQREVGDLVVGEDVAVLNQVSQAG